MMALADKVCVVTGGASGLGLEIARLLNAEGATVAVVDVDDEALSAAAASLGVRPYRCDVTDEDRVAGTLTAIANDLGKIDIVVNNVGILYSAPLVSFSLDGVRLHDSAMWEKVLATNLSSAFYVSKHAVEGMLKTRTKGVIVNISSVSARGNPGQSAYAAAKAGLEALTRVWAKELGPMGIRCFAVAPGFCDTPSTKAAVSESVLAETVAKAPLKRLGQPEEIAAGVVAGVKNSYLTGTVLAFDGGLVV